MSTVLDLPPLQDRVLESHEVHYFAAAMIGAETERDRQTQIGASSLSNPCDNCLAAEFSGIHRFSEFAERPYFGRSLGTLIHVGLAERQAIADEMFPGIRMEERVSCAFIPGYGEIPGHFDAQPTAQHVLDWKGSLRWRIALLEDLLQIRGLHRVGSEPRWKKQKDTKAYEGGYKFAADERTVVSLSAKEYRHEMEEMEYKYKWYFGQQNLYANAVSAAAASLIFIARDGTGFFDNPAFSGFNDPDRKHDIFVLTFAFSKTYTEALIARGTRIWELLSAGAPLSTFTPHELCSYCTYAAQEMLDVPPIEYSSLDTPARIAA